MISITSRTTRRCCGNRHPSKSANFWLPKDCRCFYPAAMDHSPGFLKVVNEARLRIKEITVQEARARLAQNPKAVLLDVREESEWAAGHAIEAESLGKGILE